MYLQIGSIEQVTVLRETEIGYMVGNEEEEIFLHKTKWLEKLKKVIRLMYSCTLITKIVFQQQ